MEKIKQLNFSSLIAILTLLSLFYIESNSVTDFRVGATWWFKGLRSFFWVWCAQHAAAPCRLLPGQLYRQQQSKRLRTSWRHRFHVPGLQKGQGEQAACWRFVSHQAQLLRVGSLPPAPSSPARGERQLSASTLPQHRGPAGALAPLLPKEELPQKHSTVVIRPQLKSVFKVLQGCF